MRYSKIFHELKVSEISHGILRAMYEISDISVLSMAAMATFMFNLL